ncbi:hypothetical protein EVAR_49089_1 [Eumeta japonica]|uniref:Uncharacterized protein n=1 Tax=Eumeta variegata TaxID=151549 RepID=A0A4C1Z6U3_EUMVA|nr:hypothetical protein EVAR_49089_1 [Eumeta japonica]
MDKPRKPTNIIKQKWSESSTSLRSRHIVDLALSQPDQASRSPVPARIPSPAIPGRPSPQPSTSSSTLSSQFKRSKTLRRPVACSSAVYRHFEKPTPKIPMLTSICENVQKVVYVIEIEDTERDTTSQVSNLVAPVWASTIRPANTYQVITFPDVHVSAGEDISSSSRTFRVSSPTKTLLNPESESSYDDSELSHDDDAEHRVTSAKKEIQQDLSDDEELPSQVAASVRLMEAAMDVDLKKFLSGNVKKRNNNEEKVDDCDEKAEAGRNRARSRGQKRRCESEKLMSNPPATSGTAPNPNITAKAERFDSLRTIRLTRKNKPEDVKKMKKNCEKGTIIARRSGDVKV